MREGLALILGQESDIEVVGTVADGEAAIAAYLRTKPDVGLFDLQMPVLGGAEAIESILRTDRLARLIVLTTFDGDEDIYRAMHAGAKAFLLKDTPTQELLRAVRAVNRGERYVSPEMGAKLADRMGANALSPRELKVLSLIAEGKSNKLIAAQLGITEGTVRTHVHPQGALACLACDGVLVDCLLFAAPLRPDVLHRSPHTLRRCRPS